MPPGYNYGSYAFDPWAQSYTPTYFDPNYYDPATGEAVASATNPMAQTGGQLAGMGLGMYGVKSGIGALGGSAPSAPVMLGAQSAPASSASTGLFGGLLAQAPGTTLGGSTALGAALPAAGVAAGAYTGLEQAKGIGNVLQGKDISPMQQAALFGLTGGASLLYNPVKKLFDKDMWKTEGKRLGKLQKNGVNVPEGILSGVPTKGRSYDQLRQIEVDRGADEADIKFAKSRDLNDLKGHGQSLVGYAAWAEKDPNWFNRPLDERIQIANQYLDSGAIKEHHGTIDVDPTKVKGDPLVKVLTSAPGDTAQKKASQTARK